MNTLDQFAEEVVDRAATAHFVGISLVSCATRCGHATFQHDEDGCEFCDCKWTPAPVDRST